MSSTDKRLSILSLPEVKEYYSIPQFNSLEREHFLSFTEDELAAVKRLHSHRNRIHVLLMLGYFKVKSVCLIYNWKDIEVDYQYISERYYPAASKQMHVIDRYTRSKLYKKVFEMHDYQRCDVTAKTKLQLYLQKRARVYVDETQLFKDGVEFLKSKHIAIPNYSTLQKVISRV